MTMGLSPESFEGFIIQRSRWAKGMTQILLLKNPLLHRGLSIVQRICYLNACLYWLFGVARIIFFLSPLMLLFFGLRIYNASNPGIGLCRPSFDRILLCFQFSLW